jgi:hypothetical protein
MDKQFDYDGYMRKNPLLNEDENEPEVNKSEFFTKKAPGETVVAKYKNKTGPEGLMVSEILNLEKVLKTLMSQEDVDPKSLIKLVLKRIEYIKQI